MGFLTALLTRRDIENIAAYIGNTSLSQNVLTVGLQGNGRGLVTSNPSGIACGANCATAFAPETLVTLSASPEFGSAFAGWSGACLGQINRCTLPVSAARTVLARFERNGSAIDHSGYWVSPEVLGSTTSNLAAAAVVAVTHRADTGQIAKFTQLPQASVSMFGRQFVMMTSGQWSEDFSAYRGAVYRLEDVRMSASGELSPAGAAIGEAELRIESAERMQVVFINGSVRETQSLLRLPAPAAKKPNPR
ncbi:MAG: InlB B-repeat-containing protein [Burkholderiales bacterium]